MFLDGAYPARFYLDKSVSRYWSLSTDSVTSAISVHWQAALSVTSEQVLLCSTPNALGHFAKTQRWLYHKWMRAYFVQSRCLDLLQIKSSADLWGVFEMCGHFHVASRSNSQEWEEGIGWKSLTLRVQLKDTALVWGNLKTESKNLLSCSGLLRWNVSADCGHVCKGLRLRKWLWGHNTYSTWLLFQ